MVTETVVQGETHCHPPTKGGVLGKQTHRISVVDLPGRLTLLEDFNIKSNISESKIPMNFSNENPEVFHNEKGPFSYVVAHLRLAWQEKSG